MSRYHPILENHGLWTLQLTKTLHTGTADEERARCTSSHQLTPEGIETSFKALLAGGSVHSGSGESDDVSSLSTQANASPLRFQAHGFFPSWIRCFMPEGHFLLELIFCTAPVGFSFVGWGGARPLLSFRACKLPSTSCHCLLPRFCFSASRPLPVFAYRCLLVFASTFAFLFLCSSASLLARCSALTLCSRACPLCICLFSACSCLCSGFSSS